MVDLPDTHGPSLINCALGLQKQSDGAPALSSVELVRGKVMDWPYLV